VSILSQMKMERRNAFSSITLKEFAATLSQYASIVPEKLRDLDEARYNTIPSRLSKEKDNNSLSKSEVATLVDWKLSHGKFRPILRALVQQNSEKAVVETTEEAFRTYGSSKKNEKDAKTALATLTKLKGIGPATASLLLSVNSPDIAPFFSDELFRWAMYEDGRGKGWDREIKYNVKEYLELYEHVASFRERFAQEFDHTVSAVEIEKAAYVLGKQAAGGNQIGESAIMPQSKKRKADIAIDGSDGAESTRLVSQNKKNVKTKTTSLAKSSNTATESTRKSSRRAKPN
jgi:hypothetical protein